MSRHTIMFLEKDRDTYEEILTGKKTVETRAYSPTYAQVTPGDTLVFQCADDSFEKQAMEVRRFRSIVEMFESFDYSEVTPGADSLEAAIAVYNAFPGYTERISKNGIFAFRLSNGTTKI